MSETPRVFGGRFQGLRTLRRGQGVETLLASEGPGGRQVVIKLLTGPQPAFAAQQRLEHAALMLSGAESSFLSPILDVGREGGQLYVVTPFVPGRALFELGRLGVDAALSVARSALCGLRDAHERGVLHRNLSAANLIVDGPRATLVDFGFGRGAPVEGGAPEEAIASALYASPEQAGLLGSGVTESADLYSLGVVLYECLAGQNPFRAASLGEVLRRHLTLEPPPLRSLGVPAPRALEEILQRLMRKDPRDRYQSAEAALLDVEELCGARARGEEDPALATGRRDRRRTLAEPAFVGREAELLRLEQALQEAREGRGGVALIESESGGGKTRLLDELAQRALLQGVWVLRGGCIDRGAAVPYQLLLGVAAGIAEACDAQPGLSARLRERLGDAGEAACAVLPALGAALAPAASPSVGPEELSAFRVPAGLATLLSALGTPEAPALVLLDDLQWGADQAEPLFEHLLGLEGPRHVLVVGAFRTEEAPEGHWLRRLAALRVTLSSLQPAQTRSIAESMAGPLPPEALGAVERLGAGNPFLATAVLRGLFESGALRPAGKGWAVDAQSLLGVQASSLAGEVLAGRLDRLPPDALAVLTAGALLGKSFELEQAATLSRLPWSRVLPALEEARRRHLVWLADESGWCSLVHDKVRDALLARMDAPARRELHLGAAQLYSSRPGDWSFALAYHFDAAGEPARALPHALLAAQQARARASYETAVRYFRIAQAGAAGESAAVRARISEELGHALGIRGRFDEAVAELTLAAKLSPTRLGELRALRQLGDTHFRRGAQPEAIAVLEGTLRKLGKRVPRGTAGFVLGLLREVAVQAVHSLWPRRAAPEATEEQRLVVALYSLLTSPYLLQRGPLPTLWAQLKALNLAELCAPTPERAQALADHAVSVALLPWLRRGLAYAARAEEMAQALRDEHNAARFGHYRAIVLSWAGRYRESIAADQAVHPLLERVGDATWAEYAAGTQGICLFSLGEVREAAAIGERLFRRALERSDTWSQAVMLELWSKAANGRLPEGVAEAAVERCRGVQEQVCVRRALGFSLLARGRPEEAAREFEASEASIRKGNLRGNYAGNSAVWLATALRLCVEQEPALAVSRRARLLAQAQKALRRALSMAGTFQESLPHALREEGLLEALSGRERGARAAFARSLAVARARGMRAEHAHSLWARGRAGLAAGWPDAAEELQKGGAALRALGGEPLEGRAPRGQEVTVSLVDRFAQVLAAGRAIATALSVEAVEEAVLERALLLLRAEAVMHLTAEGAISARRPLGHPLAPGEAGLALARRAIAAGAPLLDERAVPGRSALCVPIFARGQPASCLFAVSGPVEGQFGSDDLRVAGFLASLAGAALENSEHVAGRARAEREVRNLTESAIHEQEEERRRLALALHDGAGQLVAALMFRMAAMARSMPSEALAAGMAEMRGIAQAILDDLRGLTHDLRPPALDRLGLPAALQDLAKSVSTGDLSVRLSVTPAALRPGPDVSIALFRIAQAAVANLVSHAGARNATLSLSEEQGRVRLEIADDGAGFDAAAAPLSSGIGLIGMRERATWLGGTCRIESAPGRGTRVLVDVPLQPRGAVSDRGSPGDA